MTEPTKGAPKRPRGRPPLPAGEAKTGKLYGVRYSPEHGARIAYLAATHGMTISEWVLERATTTGRAKAPTPKDGRSGDV